MIYYIKLLLLLVLAGNSCFWVGFASQHRQQQAWQVLLAPYQQRLHLGVIIIHSRSGQVVFSHNSEQYFTPASTVKILTAAAALAILKPSHTFTTELLTDTPDDNKHVKNLYLRGSGDPLLSEAQLEAMVGRLKMQGVSHIYGDLVVDDTAFDNVAYGPGWMWDDLPVAFAAPVNALNIRNNQIDLYAVPAAHPGGLAHVWLVPTTPLLPLKTTVITGSNGSKETAITRPQNTPVLTNQELEVTGIIAPHSGLVVQHYALADSAWFVGSLLREKLRYADIALSGGIRHGQVPPAPNSVLLLQEESASLREQLWHFLKTSNNHGMECLLKRLGAQTSGAPGSFANGARAVQNFLATQVGENINSLRLRDGSGDSRYNLITPTQLAHTLQYIYHNFDYGPELLAALPVSGQDGTLKHRFTQTASRGKVRAKTGTMSGLSHLAGFLQGQDGETYTFVLMMEGFIEDVKTIHALQEKLCQVLIGK